MVILKSNKMKMVNYVMLKLLASLVESSFATFFSSFFFFALYSAPPNSKESN